MTKTITIIISIYLFLMFLVYSGIFLDHTDPLQIARYYFECIRNREDFLTYRISKPEFFNEDRSGNNYSKYRLYLIQDIGFILLERNDKNACVKTRIIYKDKQVSYAIVELEKNEKKWLIKYIKYKT